MFDQPQILGIGILIALLGGLIYYFWASRLSPKKTKREAPTKRHLEEADLVHVDEPSAEFIQETAARQEETPPPDAVSLEHALRETKKGFFGRLQAIFDGGKKRDAIVGEIEEILYTSDLGPKTVQHLLGAVEEKLSKYERLEFDAVRSTLKEEMGQILSSVNSGAETLAVLDPGLDAPSNGHTTMPRVWLVVGVNGAGKTTTIGKLAGWGALTGKKVLVAAGDTFRAAAGEQLRMWSERAKVEIYAPPGNAKPSGIAYDAVRKGQSENFDIVILDTAGRLHTQVNLMDELTAVRRAVDKAMPGAPHQVLLVLDANSGQNALMQAQQFNDAVGVTGVILTKLDGTAKGGVAIGLAHELKLPIVAIGVGEKIGDLRPFSTREFVDSII